MWMKNIAYDTMMNLNQIYDFLAFFDNSSPDQYTENNTWNILNERIISYLLFLALWMDQL